MKIRFIASLMLILSCALVCAAEQAESSPPPIRIDHAVGVDDLVKVGEPVSPGGALCTIHANSDRSLKEAQEILARAIEVGDAPRPPARLVDEIVG